jgi:hypothetical protein
MTETLSREGQLLALCEQKRGHLRRLERRIECLEALCAEAAVAIERGYHDGNTPALVARLRGEVKP